MKKINNLYGFLAVVFLIVLASCTKLDQTPTASIPESSLFKDSVSLNETLVGLYSTLGVKNYYGAFFPMFVDLHSDNGTAGGYDNSSLQEFSDYGVTSSNIFVDYIYGAVYGTVATANKVLAGIKTVPASARYLNSVKGQVLAIRAMAHFDLLRMFGYHWDVSSPYGISVVTIVPTATTIIKRSSVLASYNAILQDLQDAATLLENSTDRNANYINLATVNALLARVYLYRKDPVNAAKYAARVIHDGAFSLVNTADFTSVYTKKLNSESVLELPFNQQNPSFYNTYTYLMDSAKREDLYFMASQDLHQFFNSRTGDVRADALSFSSPIISPNGRTLKYSSNITLKDNSAFVIRISEMYLIRAEALGRSNDGLAALNTIRTNRGLAALTMADLPDEAAYAQAVADENRAEFNFEGHRYFDLARTGQITSVLDVPITNAVLPIPLAEINATKGAVVQNPGYE